METRGFSDMGSFSMKILSAFAEMISLSARGRPPKLLGPFKQSQELRANS
jgi:hypothetical protein